MLFSYAGSLRMNNEHYLNQTHHPHDNISTQHKDPRGPPTPPTPLAPAVAIGGCGGEWTGPGPNGYDLCRDRLLGRKEHKIEEWCGNVRECTNRQIRERVHGLKHLGWIAWWRVWTMEGVLTRWASQEMPASRREDRSHAERTQRRFCCKICEDDELSVNTREGSVPSACPRQPDQGH